jgi:hypothetical protein
MALLGRLAVRRLMLERLPAAKQWQKESVALDTQMHI